MKTMEDVYEVCGFLSDLCEYFNDDQYSYISARLTHLKIIIIDEMRISYRRWGTLKPTTKLGPKATRELRKIVRIIKCMELVLAT